jgi:[methyl-Co(III) methanol-specific corrinoid protein]:coenzyme M methyltransferase
MNSRERFLAALRGETTDRTPVAHVAALTTVALQRQTGCTMPEVHLDAERLARLCYANHEVLGLDGVTFNINYFGEPAALGSEMDWGDKTTYPSYGPPIWVEPEDAVVPGDLLDRPPIATYLEATRIARRQYGDHVGVIAKVMGPLSMVQALHGVDRTMMDMVLAPEAIRHFLDVAAEVLARCANAELEAGADAIAIGEGGAGGNMLSPQMHEQFLLDVHQRLICAIQGYTIMHICGDITPRLEALSRSGLHCFNFDWDIAPRVMVEQAAGAFRLMGNVNTADLLLGQPEEIGRQVVENLEAGVDIIGPGCAISPRCPNANLRAMVDAVIQWHADRGREKQVA